MIVQVKQAHIKILGFLVVVMLVVMIGTAWVVQRNSHNVDSLEDSVVKIQRSTDHLEQFVTTLETDSPEEQQRNAAITRAVNEVPRIKDILCEAFPEATACQEGGT